MMNTGAAQQTLCTDAEPLSAPNTSRKAAVSATDPATPMQQLTAERPAELTPAEQLRNVAEAMLRYSEVKRTHNGRGRSSTYAGDTDTLAQTGRQLAEMVLAHLAGELKTQADDGAPF